ncbi:MAG TPA: ABC transporter permease [Streptosporangiaceae bacterium]|nr:ABC transporter permease [Streptosporangiaceae bacterium]
MSAATAPAARKVSGRAGINLTVLGLEIRRLLRNRRTVIFALILPVVLFLFIGTNHAYANKNAGHGNVSAFLVVSMALYGAALATTAGGAMVSIERAQGWSRQLRLTPLSPTTYILIKAITAMVLGLASVLAVFIIGNLTGVPKMYAGYFYLWFELAAIVWIGSLVFAALGLFIGYLLPSENVMQFLGLVMAVLSFAGGLFFPLNQAAQLLQDIAKWTPLYGLNQLVHAPLIGGSFDIMWVVNAVAWFGLFVAGAVWRFRKDTARV